MEEQKQNIVQPEEVITLKDIILKLQEWRTYLLKHWIIIVSCGLAGAGLGLTYAYLMKPKYVGELTFVMEDSKSNPLASYMGLASQFGIDLGGGSSSGVFQGDNIMKFLQSRLMIEKTLLSPVIVEGRKISLADLYMNANEINKGWDKVTALKGLHFPLGLSRSKFTLKQDSVLNTIHERIVKGDLDISKLDKKLGFISVKCTSRSETFSKAFTEQLVKEATQFYVNTKIMRSKVNVDKLQLSADSLESLLNHKTYAIAASQDINRNPVRQMASVATEVQTRDKIVLQTMYAEVIKNLELSKMAMAQETPVVQIVDTPILPLKKEKLGRLKGLIVGGFLGGFFIVSFLVTKRIYKEIMEK
ncbi:Chain length determinant protein [Chitinophaga rupis]|uniref:Chain length determinant protein n=1 Tax=Chitinophaga rupis TaxID=573321 RepID=A0A1H7LLX7_9BACT|nr:hypothetical protein [Chitinophaga rupis]SEK99963.1 Chain length determinant protein [Chitinophaga rupis]